MRRPANPDYILFATTFVLLCLGIIMVFSSSMVFSYNSYGDSYYCLKKQSLAAIIGMIGLIFTSCWNYNNWRKISPFLLLFSIILLILVLKVGREAGGAHRWLSFGFISFQPSELTKFSLIIFLAHSLSRNHKQLNNFSNLLPYLFILGMIGFLIMKEPDLGTSIIISLISYFMLFIAGVRIKHLILIGIIGVVLVGILIKTEPYRFIRLYSFINPVDDIQNTDYQIWQSMLALGSGGVYGVGLAQSRQKFLYLPSPHTDFIFSILGEELGFIGTAVVVGLLVIVAWRGFRLAIRAYDSYTVLLAAGLTCHLTLQSIINLGVVTGCLPVTGVPLPFLSYGGSALIMNLLEVGILLNISYYGEKVYSVRSPIPKA